LLTSFLSPNKEVCFDSVRRYYLGRIKFLHVEMPHNKYNLLQTFPNASHQTLTHLCPPFQHFLSERLTSFGIMGTSGAPLKPLSDDSALRALSSLRGLRGAPEVPPLCRETQSLGQQMLNATVGINGAQTPHHWDGFPFTTNGIRTC